MPTASQKRHRWAAALMSLALIVGVLTAALAWRASAKDTGPQALAREPLACALPPTAASSPHPGMVWVPPGTFDLGDTVYPEEAPPRQTQVVGFWMDRSEVTNDEFAAFVAATGHVTVAERELDPAKVAGMPPEMQQPGAVVFVMPKEIHGNADVSQWWRYVPGANWRHPGGPGSSIDGRGAFPVVAVTIEDARAYARWKGRTLPSEAQWEWAARAARAAPAPTHEQPKNANTWQGLFPVMNSGDDGFVGLAPVACYAPNALGLYDIIGNVWELTADAWTPHPTTDSSTPDQVPAGMHAANAPQQVIKGGSFLCAPNYCMRYRSGARQAQEADMGTSHVGFRTILIAPGP